MHEISYYFLGKIRKIALVCLLNFAHGVVKDNQILPVVYVSSCVSIKYQKYCGVCELAILFLVRIFLFYIFESQTKYCV